MEEIPSYLHFRFDYYCTTTCVPPRALRAESGGGKKKGERRDGALACSDEPATLAMRLLRRAIHARCTLFTASPVFFFLSLNNERRNKRRPADDRYRRAREFPAVVFGSLSRSVDRGWRRLSDERDFPSGGDTVSIPLFFPSLHGLSVIPTDGVDPFLAASHIIALSVLSARRLLSVRVINDRPLIARW